MGRGGGGGGYCCGWGVGVCGPAALTASAPCAPRNDRPAPPPPRRDNWRVFYGLDSGSYSTPVATGTLPIPWNWGTWATLRLVVRGSRAIGFWYQAPSDGSGKMADVPAAQRSRPSRPFNATTAAAAVERRRLRSGVGAGASDGPLVRPPLTTAPMRLRDGRMVQAAVLFNMDVSAAPTAGFLGLATDDFGETTMFQNFQVEVDQTTCDYTPAAGQPVDVELCDGYAPGLAFNFVPFDTAPEHIYYYKFPQFDAEDEDTGYVPGCTIDTAMAACTANGTSCVGECPLRGVRAQRACAAARLPLLSAARHSRCPLYPPPPPPLPRAGFNSNCWMKGSTVDLAPNSAADFCACRGVELVEQRVSPLRSLLCLPHVPAFRPQPHRFLLRRAADVKQLPAGQFQLRSDQTLCLGVGPPGDGTTPLLLVKCDTTQTNQLWTAEQSLTDGSFLCGPLTSVADQRVVDIAYSSTAVDATVDVYGWGQTPNQVRGAVGGNLEAGSCGLLRESAAAVPDH
jgi:hypothetical protein